MIGRNSRLEPNKFYGIEVLVDNIGYALQDDLYQMTYQSVIDSMSSYQGEKIKLFFFMNLKIEIIYIIYIFFRFNTWRC
jgi:hypothetical protein